MEWPPLPPVDRVPDFDNLLAVLRRERPSRPTLYELFLNERLYRRFCEPGLLARARYADDALDRARVQVSAYARAGYDHAHLSIGIRFPRGEQRRASSLSQNDAAVIHSRADFDAYPWPSVGEADYSVLDRLLPELPGGMKLVPLCPNGVLENVIGLMGYENLGLMVYDDPGLVEDVFAAVGERLARQAEVFASHPAVGALAGNDDWGHRTQTMLSPELMRRYVFPWHAKLVAAAHRHDKPILLHSCGNLERVMDDVVALGYDAKHSFEDAICPVETMYDRWIDRIAILGGVDIDFLCRQPLEAITARCRALVAAGGLRGGYALGTGNSVPDYVDDERYLAMTRAALETGIAGGGKTGDHP